MSALLDLLLPAACAGCGRPGGQLCARCRNAFVAPSQSEDRFVVADAGVVLGDELMLAVAAFAHAGPMRRVVAALKYTGAARLAGPLAEASLATLASLLAISGPATLVPVPVHRQRQRERGYNQAQLIARELARLGHLPHANLLIRTRPTTQQHRLDRVARLGNLRQAFAFTAAPGRPPASVILVDDIVTTTATLEACASVLRAGGVASVYGFAVAREV